MPLTFFGIPLTASPPASFMVVAGAETGGQGTRVAKEPIDLDYLARQTMGDGALQREVLFLFTGQARLLASRLETAGPEERRMIGHTIKGAASGVGAFALADCAERIEREPAAEDIIATFTVLVEEVCAFAAALDGNEPKRTLRHG